MDRIFSTLERINHVEGIMALVTMIFILVTLYRTFRIKQTAPMQDKIGNFFQTWFHTGMYIGISFIAVDHLTEWAGMHVQYVTDYMSPPLSDFFFIVSAFSWACMRLRKDWFKRRGMHLTDEMTVQSGIN